MTKGYEPAYPTDNASQVGANTWHFEGGLTKREKFAAMAMQGSITSESSSTKHDVRAHWAVEAADALIAELAKEPADV